VVEPQTVTEQRRHMGLETVELCQRVLPHPDEDVRAQPGGGDDAPQRRREGVPGRPGVVRGEVLGLVEQQDDVGVQPLAHLFEHRDR
jgi:hypothetical protein